MEFFPDDSATQEGEGGGGGVEISIKFGKLTGNQV